MSEEKALRSLKAKLKEITSSSSDLHDRLKLLSEAYVILIEPFAMAGDDGAISRLRNFAGSSVEKMVTQEMERGSGRLDEAAVERIEESIGRIEWLPEGFKSSIRTEIAFRSARIRAGKRNG